MYVYYKYQKLRIFLILMIVITYDSSQNNKLALGICSLLLSNIFNL